MSIESLIHRIGIEDTKVLLAEYFAIRNAYIDKIMKSTPIYGKDEKEFNTVASKFMAKILKTADGKDIIEENDEYINTLYWDIKIIIKVKSMITSVGVYIDNIGHGESCLRMVEYIKIVKEFKENNYKLYVPPFLTKKLYELFARFNKEASTNERSRAKYNYYMPKDFINKMPIHICDNI
jgi:hypothetical protein